MGVALWMVAVVHVARAEPDPPPLHPMEIRNPPSLGTIDTGLRDASGASVGVSCVTCHEPNAPGALARNNEPSPGLRCRAQRAVR